MDNSGKEMCRAFGGYRQEVGSYLGTRDLQVLYNFIEGVESVLCGPAGLEETLQIWGQYRELVLEILGTKWEMPIWKKWFHNQEE